MIEPNTREGMKTMLLDFVEQHSTTEAISVLAEICGEKAAGLRRKSFPGLAKPWRSTERKLRAAAVQAEI